jgi:hypothetical protein
MINLPTKADVYCSDGVAVVESTLSCDAIVKATDGYVGQVDELLFQTNGVQPTHLVLIVRHIFDTGEIAIPISQIDHIENGTIYLKLDRKNVKELATVSIYTDREGVFLSEHIRFTTACSTGKYVG